MATGNATIVTNLPTHSLSSQPKTLLSSPKTLTLITRTPWLGTTTSLSLQSSTPPPTKPPLFSAIVSLCLPTTYRQTGSSSSDKIPKWSWRAIKSFALGELEARKLKLRNTGTEALLMGILNEGTSLASKFLRANGITLLNAREETMKLFGKSDLFYFTPEHPPMTEAAQRVLDWALDKKMKSGDGGEIPTSYLLLGIWSEVDSPGYKIMKNFGFTDEKAKELESLCSQPGFDDD